VDPFPDPLLLRKSGSASDRTRTSDSVARNSDHYVTEGVCIIMTLINFPLSCTSQNSYTAWNFRHANSFRFLSLCFGSCTMWIWATFRRHRSYMFPPKPFQHRQRPGCVTSQEQNHRHSEAQQSLRLVMHRLPALCMTYTRPCSGWTLPYRFETVVPT
jgi:hypothetical protein